jgi:hypothetical protein
MGIDGNDKYGKWIHTTSGCKQGGSNATLGCIAVPCNKWPEVKAMKGKNLTVCGGSGGGGTGGGGGDTRASFADQPTSTYNQNRTFGGPR